MNATPFLEENKAAIDMAKSQRHMRHTCHLDIRYFALMDWVESNQLVLE